MPRSPLSRWRRPSARGRPRPRRIERTHRSAARRGNGPPSGPCGLGWSEGHLRERLAEYREPLARPPLRPRERCRDGCDEDEGDRRGYKLAKEQRPADHRRRKEEVAERTGPK